MSALAVYNSPFNLLLRDIGKELKLSDVRYMKYLLQGHVNKETLEHLDSGLELTEVLRKRGLVSEKKLAFMRKLLIEAKCLKQVNLVDEFREKFTSVTIIGERQQSQRASRLNNRRETLLRMIESVESEIRTCEDAETEITNQIKEFEVQVQANSENLVIVEETIQNLKNKIVEQETEIESFERKLETVRFFLKKRQVEVDKVKQKLDENHSSAAIKRELKEKQEEHEKGKRDEDELIAKHQTALDLIRTTHVEIRHKTQDIIALEDNIHDLLMQIRQLKQSARKNQRTSSELQEKLENLSLELEDTRRLKPLTPFSRPRSQVSLSGDHGNFMDGSHITRRLEYKVLDYGEISESESTVIGRKGKRACPPQFQYPSSVAVDRALGNIYVADYGNARIQILEVNGNMAREPLVLGGKCRPCALAVSLRGDLVMTDSQILRVFSKTGELIRPILPVYSKNDKRPELSAVAFDIIGNIYAADKANHRIQKFTFDGNFLCFIGGLHDLHCPMGIVVKKNGDVIVTEYENHRLKIFSQENLGESKTLGTRGVGSGKFFCPRGVALDQNDNILVADSQNHRIQVVSSTGESLGTFGMIGSDPGCLDNPYDVAMDASGNIIVADAKNHRLQIFTRLVPVYAEPAMYDEEYEAAAVTVDEKGLEINNDDEVEHGIIDAETSENSKMITVQEINNDGDQQQATRTDKVLEESQNSGIVNQKFFREKSSRQSSGNPRQTEINNNK